jgi:small subunit ribosomal protein S1
MHSKKTNDEKGTEQMPFDQSWWDFVISNEPTDYIENSGNVNPKKSMQHDLESNIDWNYIEQLYQKDVVVPVTIVGYNKGGLLAKTEKLQGFIPVSHIIFRESSQQSKIAQDEFSERIGTAANVKVIECNRELNKIVLSERAALTEDGKRKELITNLSPNTVVQGRVTNITNFGIFVDLGGVEGLVHISELSWGRVRNPEEHAKLDDEISVLILSIEPNEMHVALSIKRLKPNPWFELERKYQPGDVVNACVTKILPYGVFAELEEGVEGLIHISTLEMNDKIRNLNDVFNVNQTVLVEILHIDSKKHRLGLALAKMNN